MINLYTITDDFQGPGELWIVLIILPSDHTSVFVNDQQPSLNHRVLYELIEGGYGPFDEAFDLVV